jgi:hypothetical protein
MADVAGTPGAGNSGDNGAAGASTGFQAPAEWAEVETYKPFFVEKDGAKSFDVNGLATKYAETVKQIPVVPAKADDYSFEFPKDFSIDEAVLKLEKEAAKNLGLTQAQFEGMQKHALSEYARMAQEVAAKSDTAKAELVKEWGGPQKFDANLAKVNKAAEAFFGKDAFTNEALTNNPVVMRGLFKIAEKLTEDTLKSGSGSGADSRPVGLDGRPMLDYSKTTPGPASR